MNNQNEESSPVNKPEFSKNSGTECGAGCACNATEPWGWLRWAVFLVVIVAATAIVVKGIVGKNGASCCPAAGAFPAVTAPGQASIPGGAAGSSNAVAIKEIAALSDLNSVAADMAGVFVYLPATNQVTGRIPADQISAAVKIVETQARGKIGVFTLKSGSPEYNQVAAQMAVPGVIAMVKGRGMAPVSGEITETKLVQAFVAASSSGGCGAGGCGPAGCK